MSLVRNSIWLNRISERFCNLDINSMRIVCQTVRSLNDLKLATISAKGRITSAYGTIKRRITSLENCENQNENRLNTFPDLQSEYSDRSLSFENWAVSPMAGVLGRILVKRGERVKKGDPLFIVMVLQFECIVMAVRDGTINRVVYKVGDDVAMNVPVVVLKEENLN